MHQARPVQTLPPAGHFIFVNFAWFCSIARPAQKELGPFSENPSTRLSVFTWLHGGHIAWMLATWVNTLYTKNVKFERDLWTTNEEYRYAKSPNCVRGTRTQPLICFWCSVHYWVTCAINKGVTEINTLDQIIGKVMDMSRTHVPLNVLIGLARSLNSDVKAFKPVNSM